MNPSTLGFYLPLIHALQTSSTDPESTVQPNKTYLPTFTPQKPMPVTSKPEPEAWSILDAQFRRSLPDEWYTRRLMYRGSIMDACPNARVVDGVEVSGGERKKARGLMDAATARA